MEVEPDALSGQVTPLETSTASSKRDFTPESTDVPSPLFLMLTTGRINTCGGAIYRRVNDR
jgi:hypothetical protein